MDKKLEEYSREELIEEIKSLKRRKKFGLVWEDKKEEIVEKCKNEIPVFKEIPELAINEKPGEPTNLIIEGDNFASLQVLNYTHHGKIDVIYIDPPYNTGNKDFIYNDSYVDSEDSFRHSKWLSFMDRRLRLARELLSDDGVIFISIDDNEQAALKIICDSIYGENNFVACIPRLTSAQRPAQESYISIQHDYVLVYVKQKKGTFRKTIKRQGIESAKTDQIGTYISGDTSPILASSTQGYSSGGDYDFEYKGKIYSPIASDGSRRRWLWTESRMKKAAELGILIPTSSGGLRVQNYIDMEYEVGTNEMKPKDPDLILASYDFMGSQYVNKFGSQVLVKAGVNFSFPKPVSLIVDLIKLCNKDNAIVLDFFAGSGTTGQAVLELNKEDGGNRKFILCTNDESNIARDVTYPRVKTVVTGIRPDGSKYSDGISANVRYFTTDFIEKGITGDVTRAKLFEKSDEMIQVRENAFELVDKNDDYIFYKNSEKFVAIIKDPFNFGPIWYELEEKNTEKLPVKLYVFSYSNYTFEDEIPDTDLKYEICAIPNSIMEVYRKISDKKEER